MRSTRREGLYQASFVNLIDVNLDSVQPSCVCLRARLASLGGRQCCIISAHSGTVGLISCLLYKRRHNPRLASSFTIALEGLVPR